MSEIKNCPFCGASASASTDRIGDWLVSCDECEIQTIEYCSKSEAIETWNVRTENKRIAELEAALRLIETFPIPQQDDQMSANMREIARAALEHGEEMA